jgi:AcrR family transcriptional regulator
MSAREQPGTPRPEPEPEGAPEPAPRRRGRTRSDASRRAILDAALALVGEQGYAQLTIEGIAARAGTGKQTIYRWWPSKAAVVLEALNAAAAMDIPVPDTGSLSGDLTAFLRSTFAAGSRRPYTHALTALMAAAQLDPAFGASFREDFIGARRTVLRTLLDRAVERGEWTPRVPLDTLVDVVFGVLWYRVLVGHAPLDDRLAAELAEIVVT